MEQYFLDLVKKRQSVRAYKTDAVEPEKIARCIEAARLSPSACNAQPWKFIVVDDQKIKNQIADLTTTKMVPMNHFTKQAPVHVVLVMENPNLTSFVGSVIRDKPFTLIDIGIAAVQFCLQASAEGLGTCMIGWFNEKKVKKLLNIPSSKRAVLVITLGYPEDDTIREKIRKPVEQIYSRNSY
ncbi:MAG TPA: nitroreductase family protein [Bacteroidales bacterium]|nr:nitroreductase family protein [Bacteroidales bacterium]